MDVVFQDLTFASDVFNQELRLTSDADQRFRWLVGAFYQERDELANVFVAFSDNSPVNAGMTILNQNNKTTSDSRAAFGQLDYDLSRPIQKSRASWFGDGTVTMSDGVARDALPG